MKWLCGLAETYSKLSLQLLRIFDILFLPSRFYSEKRIVTEEINEVAKVMTSLISNECSGDEELTYLTLRVHLICTIYHCLHGTVPWGWEKIDIYLSYAIHRPLAIWEK